MFNKKGISPLIATVLILGFTVALAAVIMTWGTGFVKKMQTTTEETAMKQIESADIMVSVKSYRLMGNRIGMLLENSGSKKIERFKARLTGSSGADSVEVNESLDGYGIKYMTVTWDYNKTGPIKEVELLPVVTLGGEEFISVNTPATVEESDLEDDSARTFFVDEFDTFETDDWSKGGTVENIDGEMKLIGTGSSYDSNFYGNVYYDRSKNPTLKVDFKVNTVSTDTIFHVASEGYGTGGNCWGVPNYRRYAIIVRTGLIQVQLVDDAVCGQLTTIMDPVYADVWYTLEIEFSNSGSKLYVYERDKPRPSQPQHTMTKADWNPRFHFWIYSETGYIDNAVVLSD